MATAVALTTELSQPDGGDIEVVNALLSDIAPGDMPAVSAAAAVLAATLGRAWAERDATGPAEVLAHIGLITQQRRTP